MVEKINVVDLQQLQVSSGELRMDVHHLVALGAWPSAPSAPASPSPASWTSSGSLALRLLGTTGDSVAGAALDGW